MDGLWIWIAAPGCLLWGGLLLLPWQPWRVRERLEAAPGGPGADLGLVTAVIPARNEAALLPRSLGALAAQSPDLEVVLVDDCSEDGTAAAARRALPGIRILAGSPPPEGWTGKLWALEQGIRRVETPFVLLLDADIQLASGLVAALLCHSAKTGAKLVSLMATLPVRSFWERLLLPAFVFFFKLLYPFGLSNSRCPRVAAAAGGCLLVETRILRELGGFGPQRDALIDDCALARRVKSAGHRTWIGLSHSVESLRSSGSLRSIWNMVARTAFVQLRCSWLGLLACTVLLLAAFVLPLSSLCFGGSGARILSALVLLAMWTSYQPTLGFYRLSRAWGLALPLVGTLYGAMTWTSAWRYAGGMKSKWKGRVYPRVTGERRG